MFLSAYGIAQNLQLHYDFRHMVDPEQQPKNFTVLSFEYFKDLDTLGTGSFLFKFNAHLDGKNSNMGQVFSQISQSLKFWKPKVYMSFNYSGGLGVTSGSFGYYVSNSFGIGVSSPFEWRGAIISVAAYFRYNAFRKPSYDPQLTLYLGKGIFEYKVFIAGSFVFWTQNRDQGDEYTGELKGKKLAFFGDPQIWFRIKKGFSAGSRVNVYYHLLNENNTIQFYPTFGVKYQF
jgi:hypothetical protein